MATAHRIEPVAATHAVKHQAAPPATCDIAGVAALLEDSRRAAILSAVLDGRSFPAGELARVAGVTPATASTPGETGGRRAARGRAAQEASLLPPGQRIGGARYRNAGDRGSPAWRAVARCG
ncbi:MAG TPA: hypothetical protein VFK39_07545 [Gemmatimonadaceae bacterium]|nr:hypothetical protein [Gemmatimonadaceae bacterium]